MEIGKPDPKHKETVEYIYLDPVVRQAEWRPTHKNKPVSMSSVEEADTAVWGRDYFKSIICRPSP